MKRNGASGGLALMGIASLASVSLTATGLTAWSVLGWTVVAALGAHMIVTARRGSPAPLPTPGTRRIARIVNLENESTHQRVRVRYEVAGVTHIALFILEGDERLNGEERVEVFVNADTGLTHFIRALDAAA